MVLTTGKITTGKKGTVVWPAMFFGGFKLQPKKITTGRKKNQSQNNPPEIYVVLVPAKIWRELAPYYFTVDCFEKKN